MARFMVPSSVELFANCQCEYSPKRILPDSGRLCNLGSSMVRCHSVRGGGHNERQGERQLAMPSAAGSILCERISNVGQGQWGCGRSVS